MLIAMTASRTVAHHVSLAPRVAAESLLQQRAAGCSGELQRGQKEVLLLKPESPAQSDCRPNTPLAPPKPLLPTTHTHTLQPSPDPPSRSKPAEEMSVFQPARKPPLPKEGAS